MQVMVLAGLPLLFVLNLLPSPQLGQNRIEGRIQVPASASIPEGATARLRRLSGSEVARASVSGNGRFTFDRLPAGQYIVTVEADAYEPAEQQVEITAGFLHNVVNITVPLTPRARPELTPGPREHTVPAGALAISKEAVKELGRAEELARKKQLRAAIEHLEKAIALAPRYFQAFNNLGVYRFQLGEKQAALEAFEQALQIHPEAVDPHGNMGIVYLELGRPQEALTHLERAVDLAPTSSRFSYQLARARILLQDFAGAEDPLRRALELKPPVAHARYLLAHVLYELGRKSEAVNELKRYLKTNPKNRAELEAKITAWTREIR